MIINDDTKVNYNKNLFKISNNYEINLHQVLNVTLKDNNNTILYIFNGSLVSFNIFIQPKVVKIAI